MSDLSIQRRTRRRWVQLQARLEAGLGDRFIPLTISIVLTAVLAAVSLARLGSFEAGDDLAAYTQAVWLLGEGFQPEASLLGDDVHLLELHWSFILYPLAALSIVFPTAKMLVIAQSVALGLTVFPLWWLARRVANLRTAAASALVFAYALHPATHRLAIDDFHPEVLAIPAMVALAYFGASKRWFGYWVCVGIVLACRADLGLAVGLWGFVLLGDGERRAGLWTLGVGLVWSLGLLLVVQPLVGEAVVTGGQYGAYGDSLGEVVLNGLRNPLELLQDLTSRPNVLLVVSLLAPMLFLPLLSIRHLLPAVPLTGLFLIAESQGSGAFAERTSLLLAFTFIAAPYALNRLGQLGVQRVFIDGRLLATVAAAAVLSFISASPISIYDKPWEWGEADPVEQAILEAAERLPSDVAVRASPSALASLAERPWLYSLATDREPSVQFDAFDVRAILVVDRDILERTDERREEFAMRMEALGGFELVVDDAENGVSLFVKP